MFTALCGFNGEILEAKDEDIKNDLRDNYVAF